MEAKDQAYTEVVASMDSLCLNKEDCSLFTQISSTDIEIPELTCLFFDFHPCKLA